MAAASVSAASPRARAAWRDRRVRMARRWLLAPVVTLLVASFLIFAALAESPGDPVAQLLGQHATAAQAASLRHALGLDQPLLPRYWHWLTSAVHGDFGTSITYRAPVSSLLAPRIPTTLFLVGYAALLAVLIGLGLGIAGGAARRAAPAVAAVNAVTVAVPSFVAAVLLVLLFSLKLGWFPAQGSGSGFGGQLWHLTLPAVALAISWTAYLSQVTQRALTEEQRREHVETARMRGIGRLAIFRRHVLRNAAPPVVTISALTVAGLVTGTVVVEEAFGINGMGALLASSVQARDDNVVLAISVFFVLIFVVTTTLLDVTETVLDPRLRDAGAHR
jgi:peptide/nickel transport system permease protein